LLGDYLVEGIVPVLGLQAMGRDEGLVCRTGGCHVVEPYGVIVDLYAGRGDGFEQVACLVVVI
jgi:hypothetical protein